MELYHYLLIESSGEMSRVLTSSPATLIAEAYAQSKLTREVVTTPFGTKVYALDTGSWGFPILQHRGIDRGVPFYIASYDMKAVAQWDDAYIAQRVTNANFVLASADNLVLFRFANYDGFDLEPFGIKIKNGKKLAKRAIDVVRCSGTYIYDPDADITIQEFKTPEGEEDTYYDGANMMRQSLADRLGYTYMRGWMRLDTQLGQIKGDFAVVPDGNIEADLVYHTENLKDEFCTDGWQMLMVMKHMPSYDLRHNDQVRANFSFFIPREKVDSDLAYLVNTWRASIKEGGELYAYLSNQQAAFNDPIAVDLDRIHMDTRLEEVAELLREVGIPPATFSNIVYTRTGALARRMDAGRLRDDSGRPLKHFSKMFIPATNAFTGAVMTYEALTKMGNVEYENQDGSVTFFDEDYGLIIPGSRFHATFDLHGGHDQDDGHGMYGIKVYCSDDEKLNLLFDHGVLDPSLTIGRTADEAVLAAVAIRMPNGPGEYSIEAVDWGTMPWRHYDERKLRTVDLANAPLPQNLVFEGAETVELEASVDYDQDYDRGFALNAVLAQMVNPDVGPFANVIMTAAATFGPDNIPKEMIRLKMEDVIDTVQQEADLLKFSAISDEVEQMWICFRDYVIEHGIKVDAGILATRVPYQLGAGRSAIPVGSAILEAMLVDRDGDTNRLHMRYHKAHEIISEAGKLAAKKARNETELAQRIAKGKFSTEVLETVDGLLRRWNGALKKLDREYRGSAPGDDDQSLNAVLKREHQIKRRLATEELMDKWTDEVVNNRFPTHYFVMAMYYRMLQPMGDAHPFGDNDRIFVQPTSAGHVSLMQLFIEACKRFNLLPETTVIKAARIDNKEK